MMNENEDIKTEESRLKLKICLVGESAVGKTSLIRRFVYNEYDDKYISTLGTKVTKKEITVKNPKNGEMQDVIILVWDIMGDKGFRSLLQEAYFYGANGIIGVCDTTREETLLSLNGWMHSVHTVTGAIPSVFLGNKCDLKDEQQLGLNEIKSFASGFESSQSYFSSAKTGENVEEIFSSLAQRILENMP